MTVPVPSPWVYAESPRKMHLAKVTEEFGTRVLCGVGLRNLIVEDEPTTSGERATCNQCRKRADLEPVRLVTEIDNEGE